MEGRLLPSPAVLIQRALNQTSSSETPFCLCWKPVAWNLVLCGHDHHYERSQAIKEGAATLHEEGGIYYFVVGSGGAGLRAAEAEWWSDAVDDENHAFLDLSIQGCTAHGTAIGIPRPNRRRVRAPGLRLARRAAANSRGYHVRRSDRRRALGNATGAPDGADSDALTCRRCPEPSC